MRSTLVTAAMVIFMGTGASAMAQNSSGNIKPTDPGTDTTGKSGNPARVLPQDARPMPQDTQPMPPTYDTRFPREPRVLPTPNNMPLPEPRRTPEPEREHQDQSGM